MSVIPCERDDRLRAEIARFAEALKTEAHRLDDHGLSEADFYRSPIFRGAIEQVRGAETMRRTVIHRNDRLEQTSEMTPIRRV